MVAAATTSLPEVPHGERNWDYRYCWLRDSAFTLWSLYALGFDWEADDFFWFLADIAQRDDEVQVVYGVDGERMLSERILDRLSGYDGARPVRVGNEAYTQRQHDVWGTMLQAIHIRLGSWQRLDSRIWLVVRRQVESALKYWREPDLGIWEVRGAPQHFTFSKLMCWSAVQRGAQAALARGEATLAKTWREAADEIRGDILAHGVDDRGVFTQHYETRALDASLLLLPMTGFLPREDPRVRATILAIADELTEDGLVLRYRPEETDDGLPGGEGTFTICSFLLVSALCEIGEPALRRAALRAAAVTGQLAGPVRRGDRPADRPPAGQLPAGLHPPGADQRGHPCDQGAAPARRPGAACRLAGLASPGQG